MGLLLPKEGHIEIDNAIINYDNLRDWQNRITHVPQTIYLADGTIKENIAFGVDASQTDFDRVRWASERAQIFEFINLLPDKYETKVGERGVMLSGGQRQRIGIARALYKKVDVIIMDEATSALDEKTEQEVIRQIEKLDNITIIMISHRLTTLNGCNKIINISDKKAYLKI
jgi:ATP-binding cassette subfamily B protein